ncbi:MAG: cell envelope integrity protein CreD, partial [Hyphomicrobiaceae bacterium]
MVDTMAGALGRLVRSPAFKFFLIGGLLLLLAIPLLLVYALIDERVGRQGEVSADLARSWAGSQIVSGPYLVVPYRQRVSVRRDKADVEEIVEREAVFLPETLDVKASTDTRTLSRAIYDVTVYDAIIRLDGRFAAPELASASADIVEIRWRDAVLSLGLAQVSGLKSAAAEIAGTSIAFEPSLGLSRATYQSGIHAPLATAGALYAADASSSLGTDARALGPVPFVIELALRGSSELSFAPVARATTVSLESTWPHPSFSGAFLPDDRSISPLGFKARWSVPSLARSVPSAFVLDDYGMTERFGPYVFGARFYVPVDLYDLASRATKYGLLFLAAAYLAVFLLEVLSGRSVHPVQYVMVGLAIVFFYVLLLS